MFCYSHNTRRVTSHYRELSIEKFVEYAERNRFTLNDTVILNGGEPTLHSRINDILELLQRTKCDVAIFTNGRKLGNLDNSFLNERFRFIVPIHGDVEVHDNITGVKGSYEETVNSLSTLAENCPAARTDVKIIINEFLFTNPVACNRLFETMKKLPFNNAIHITKMADTKVSQCNGCISLKKEEISSITAEFFDIFVSIGKKIKIYDTCVKFIDVLQDFPKVQRLWFDKIYYQDYNTEKMICFDKQQSHCQEMCFYRPYCLSGVKNNKVLLFQNGMFLESLE